DYLCSQADGYDVSVVKDGAYYQPLCAIYHKNCLPFIEQQLAHYQYRVANFFANVHVRAIEMSELIPLDQDGISFLNINTPDDYRIAQEIASRELT
ncbi:MAG: molybdenum cofactor guanylyltransferase, partial [Firmicutes bacterium]|nr:molybdenum cofactor guanylyltransferase [Bacillota bacterium]